MKLELKQLIDTFKYQDDIYGSSDFWKIVKISDTYITLYNGKNYNEIEIKKFLIDYSILKHPLSDLIKEIEVNGEKFVPIDIVYNIWYEKGLSTFSKRILKDKICLYYEIMPYWLVKKLLEWHFDIHNLIENNLAIDINTL